MQTIAFETQPMNGWIQIPDVFKDWYDKTLKVILLRDETTPSEINSSLSIPQGIEANLLREQTVVPSDNSVSHRELTDEEIGLEGEALETFRKIRAISKRCATLPDLDTRSPDEILGYNEFGGFD